MSADGLTFLPPRLPGCGTIWVCRPGTTVIDLGAGTGKFTRLLVETGATVTAVEPVAAMLEQLSRDLPGVTALPGDAQHIPLAGCLRRRRRLRPGLSLVRHGRSRWRRFAAC